LDLARGDDAAGEENAMGYEIYIGEWDLNAKPEEEGACARTVEHIELPNAPAFDGDDSGHSNCRRPSYSTWHDFGRASGLGGLFHGTNGLFAEHPGTVRLTKQHARIVRTALKAYRAKHPTATPRFCASTADAHLARLEWLAWWIDWALATCKIPAIHNR
jgi:hypothetical protein